MRPQNSLSWGRGLSYLSNPCWMCLDSPSNVTIGIVDVILKGYKHQLRPRYSIFGVRRPSQAFAKRSRGDGTSRFCENNIGKASNTKQMRRYTLLNDLESKERVLASALRKYSHFYPLRHLCLSLRGRLTPKIEYFGRNWCLYPLRMTLKTIYYPYSNVWWTI